MALSVTEQQQKQRTEQQQTHSFNPTAPRQ